MSSKTTTTPPTTPRFDKVRTELDFPRDEAEIGRFWKEARIFEKSLARTANGAPFIFYEGPPTANGLPHNGHVLTRVVKDLFPRYKTMRGFHVPRKAGWDTHGLPVEVEVEKELRMHGKAAIEAYGIEPFVKKCIESVFRYTKEWETVATDRVAFWVDTKSAYVTFHRSYVESVWWALSELFKKNLLYRGHKVVWWWAQGGTALSSAEVGLGYKDVDDPSVFVAFPLSNKNDRALAVWTTTPWTLPSNMYAAVNPKYEYAVVRGDPEKVKAGWAKKALERELIVAKDLVDGIAKKLGTSLTIVETIKAGDLVGTKYEPPFDLFKKDAPDTTWRVIAADFVTLDAGTGIVHIAPAFGEDDFQAHRKLYGGESTIFCAVKPDGTFIDEIDAPSPSGGAALQKKFAGRWVKEADKDLTDELKEKGVLVHSETFRHPYPFCWRADSDPLIQLARPAWYIRTTEKKDSAIADNRAVSWLPEHIKEGRMGDFLANNVDWALSRERYWGTPLNVWINDVSGKMEAPCSVDEILSKNPRAFDHFHEMKKKDPTLSDHLIVHKPWIDHVTWQNPGEEGTYRRVPEVIDCWFDSGCMPFAQWGFPHQGVEDFKKSFPADFISEAIDQTRGWFYSLMMVSTLVFDEATQKRLAEDFKVNLTIPPQPHPYKTCIVLGHVCDKEGKKESKTLGNYTPPDVILDAVRMDFAVLDEKDVEGVPAKAGVAYVAREDMEGLDLIEGAKIRVFVPKSDGTGAPNGETLELKIEPHKKLRRRVVVLHADDRTRVGASPSSVKDVKPVEVPRRPNTERVSIVDPTTPAPGADAFRWFFYASNPPWSNTRHSLANVRALQKETLVKLRNVYSFFTIYANIDGFDPTDRDAANKITSGQRDDSRSEAERVSRSGGTPPQDGGARGGEALSNRKEIDRWILSELHLLVDAVTKDLDGYDLYTATGRITTFVDALSNWYVRRSRDRFWSALEKDGSLGGDKRAAYETLWQCLTTLAQVMAPFTPYLSDSIWRNLATKARSEEESVHLTTWPSAEMSLVDKTLSQSIAAVRALVSLGLQVRTQAKLKVRQPLSVAKLILADAKLADRLTPYLPMIADELNVLNVEVLVTDADKYVTYKVKPNFRTLGQKGMGKQAQDLKKSMPTMSPTEAQALVATLLADGKTTVHGVDLDREDVEVAFDAKEGYAAAGDRVGVVVLDTRLDDALRDLGYLRELLNRIQTARKEMGLDFVDRIHVRMTGTDRTARVVKANDKTIVSECLAIDVTVVDAISEQDAREIDVEGDTVRLLITRAP